MKNGDIKQPPVGIVKCDAAVDFSWVFEFKKTQHTVIQTRNPCNEFLRDVLCRNPKSFTLHAVITGWGQSVIEPNVPAYKQALNALINLVSNGFPKDQIVICVDPIIPWNTMPAFNVIHDAYYMSFRRFILRPFTQSEYTSERFHKAGFGTPADLGISNAQCKELVDAFETSLRQHHYGIIFENDIPWEFIRAGRKKLLDKPFQCIHGCLYCPYANSPDETLYSGQIQAQIQEYENNISEYTSADKYLSCTGKQVLEELALNSGIRKQDLTYDKIIECAHKELIQQHIINRPIREVNNKQYYFDDNEILQIRTIQQRDQYTYMASVVFNHFNGNLFKKTLKQTPIGATLTEFCENYYNTKIAWRANLTPQWTFLEQLITRIEKPVFERATGNTNKKTFDFIRVFANVNSNMFSDRKTLVETLKEHKSDIDEMILKRIAETSQFKKYNVPISCLQCTSCTLTKRYELEYVFELKASLQTDKITLP